MCPETGKHHFCCRQCATRGRNASAVRVCRSHKKNVRFAANLWHDASTEGLVTCPFGCWIAQSSQSTHQCPREKDGPISIPGVPLSFSSLKNACDHIKAREKTLNVYSIGSHNMFAKVVFSAPVRAPEALRFLVCPAKRWELIRVRWRNHNDNNRETEQLVVATPADRTGTVKPLLPLFQYSPLAAPASCRITGVDVAASADGFTTEAEFEGATVGMWSAISESPCARLRYPMLRRAEDLAPRVARWPSADNTGMQTLTTQFATRYPPELPRFCRITPGERVRCGRCGLVFKSILHFLSKCAPDADHKESAA